MQNLKCIELLKTNLLMFWTQLKKKILDALRSAFARHDEFNHFNAQNNEKAHAYKHAPYHVQELCNSKGTSQGKGPMNAKCNCQKNFSRKRK